MWKYNHTTIVQNSSSNHTYGINKQVLKSNNAQNHTASWAMKHQAGRRGVYKNHRVHIN